MYASGLQLREQVSCGISPADQVPATFLLPGDEQCQHDAVPDRIQLRRGGHVHADGVLSGDVCDVRGQEVVRPVPRGALLPHGDVDCLVPGGVLLSDRGVGADAVSCKHVLPAGVGQAQKLPSAEELGAGVQVGRAVQMRRAGLGGRALEPLASGLPAFLDIQ